MALDLFRLVWLHHQLPNKALRPVLTHSGSDMSHTQIRSRQTPVCLNEVIHINLVTDSGRYDPYSNVDTLSLEYVITVRNVFQSYTSLLKWSPFRS